MEPVWDHDTLRSWFETRPGEDVAETDLLRAFFPDDPFADGVGLELFHKHFLLYRRLWLFDDELRTTTGHRLWIRGIRSTLLDPPPLGRCGWLDPGTGQYCLENLCPPKDLCPRHGTSVPEVNGLKAYYLDWKNLEGMTDEGVRDMVENFFRWMGSRGSVLEALEIFGLPPDADAQTIKARWRQLSLEHHPDRGGDSNAYKKFSAAWTALKFLDE